MKPTALLLGLAALGAAGLAAFFLLGNDSSGGREGSEPISARPTDTVARPAGGAGAEAQLAAAPTADEADETPVQRTEAKAVPTGDRDRVRPPSLEEGEEEWVKGLVVDSYGNPIGGAAITVEGVGDTGSEILPLFGVPIPKRETVSKDDGSFRVLRSGRWSEIEVEIERRGFLEFSDRRDLLTEDGDEQLGAFTLEYGVVLGGMVVDANGDPVAEAEVQRIEEDESRFSRFRGMRGGRDDMVTTGADGRFELLYEEPGSYILQVEHETFPDKRFRGETPAPGGENLSLVLSLAPPAQIAGRIVDYPIGKSHVRVTAERTDRRPEGGGGGAFEAMMVDAGFSAEGLEADVEENGTFVVKGLEAGAYYELRAFSRNGFFGRVPVSDEKIVEAGAKAELTWDPGASLSFEAVNGLTQGSVKDLVVRYRWNDSSGGGFPNSVRKRSFSTGDVELTELRPPNDQGTLSVLVSAPGYLDHQLEDVAIALDSSVDLGNVKLQPAPKVRIQVVDALTSEPVYKATVRLSPEDEDGEEQDRSNVFFELTMQPSSGKTDREGWVELPACATPTAALKVTARKHTTLYRNGLVMPQSGTKEEVVSMLEGGRIQVLVVDPYGDPVRDVSVEHRYPEGDDFDTSWRETNKRGEINLNKQAPGEHSFRPTEGNGGRRRGRRGRDNDDDDEEGWETITVLNGQETLLTLRVNARAKVTGTVTSGGKPLAKAQVMLLDEGDDESEEVVEMRVRFGGRVSGSTSYGTTNRRGQYELEDVPTGTYRLRVTHDDRAMPYLETVVVNDRGNEFDVDLPLTAIEGRVTGPDGEPVAGASVRVVANKATSDEEEMEAQALAELFGRGGSRQETEPDGSYRLEGVVEGTGVVVLAEADGYVIGRSQEVTLSSGQLRSGLNVQLGAGGTLRIRVTGDVNPFTFVTAVRQTDDEEEGSNAGNVETARVSDGYAVMEGIKPGTWEVRIANEEASEQDGVLVDVKAGEEATVEIAP
ncbi:MAG: carboxypeptidase-like regulatory domain-containing protein [Planctomycetota bacterium]